MKTRFKFSLAILAFEVLLGVALNLVVTGNAPPTAPATAEELSELRHVLTKTPPP